MKKSRKYIKLPRKLKKAIKYIRLKDYNPIVNEVNDPEKGIFIINMKHKTGIGYKGKMTKYKIKAVYLVRKELIKKQMYDYRNLANKF